MTTGASTTFTSGLRQRLDKSNVALVTIKPGFVDTPMTEEFKKGILWARPNAIAKKIVLAIDNKKTEVYVPLFWCLVMLIIKFSPQKILNKPSLFGGKVIGVEIPKNRAIDIDDEIDLKIATHKIKFYWFSLLLCVIQKIFNAFG